MRFSLPPLAGGVFRLVNVALLTAVAGLAAAAYLTVTSKPAQAKSSVRTAAVTRGVVLSSVSATGSVVAPQDLDVNFETSGELSDIAVKQGDRVTKGEILGQLDATSAQSAVNEARANLATAEATLAATRAGATSSTKRQDSISMQQASAAIRQAQQSAALDAKSQAMTLTNAKRQLRTDRGNEAAYVAAVKADNTKIAADQTAYDTATGVVNADQAKVNSDKASEQSLTDGHNSMTLQQTEDQQKLSADTATLNAQTTTTEKAHWQAIVNDDQANVNADAVDLQQNSSQQSNLSYQESLDDTQLTNDTQTQSTALSTLNDDKATLTSDQQAIASFEGKIVADKQALATALLAQETSTQKDAQSISSARLSAQATAAGNAVKEAPATASTLAQQEAALLQAEAALTDAQKTLDQTILRAPVDGTVAAVDGVLGQQMAAGGVSNAAASSSSSSGSSSTAFVSLVGVSSMEATAAFAESDAAKLRVGQAATVTIPALSDKELPAHVVAMDDVGTSSSSVVEYNVTVALDRNDASLKPGMTANVSIVTAERDNVLTVPSAAVTGSGANASVKVVDASGNQTTVQVIAGLQGDSTTEIVSGLRKGQNVVVSTISASSLTSNSQSSQNGRFGGGGAAFFGGGAVVNVKGG